MIRILPVSGSHFRVNSKRESTDIKGDKKPGLKGLSLHVYRAGWYHAPSGVARPRLRLQAIGPREVSCGDPAADGTSEWRDVGCSRPASESTGRRQPARRARPHRQARAEDQRRPHSEAQPRHCTAPRPGDIALTMAYGLRDASRLGTLVDMAAHVLLPAAAAFVSHLSADAIPA